MDALQSSKNDSRDEGRGAVDNTSNSSSDGDDDVGSEAEKNHRRDCHVIALMKVNNVDFRVLSNHSGLLNKFKLSIASALAVVAGNWIDPEHVELALQSGGAKGHSPSSVAVHARIGRPSFVSADWVQSTLSESASLGQTVADMVASTEGMQEASLGTVAVSGVRIYRGDGSAGSPCRGPPVVSAVALQPRQPAAAEPKAARAMFGTAGNSGHHGIAEETRREGIATLFAAIGVLAVCVPYCFWRRRQGQASYAELRLVVTEEGELRKDDLRRPPPEEMYSTSMVPLGPDEPLMSGN